jgi:hypothetical protein
MQIESRNTNYSKLRIEMSKNLEESINAYKLCERMSLWEDIKRSS